MVKQGKDGLVLLKFDKGQFGYTVYQSTASGGTDRMKAAAEYYGITPSPSSVNDNIMFDCVGYPGDMATFSHGSPNGIGFDGKYVLSDAQMGDIAKSHPTNIHVFGCYAAVDGDFLQRMANLTGAVVWGSPYGLNATSSGHIYNVTTHNKPITDQDQVWMRPYRKQ